VDRVVMRALAFKPGDRYPTAEAMAAALREASPIAHAGEIAAWLEKEAADDLEISEERVRLMEREPPPPDASDASDASEVAPAPPRSRRALRVASVVAALLLAGLVFGVVRARRDPHDAPPVAHEAPPEPSAAPSAAPASASVE